MPATFSCGITNSPSQPNAQLTFNPLAICTDNSSVKWIRVNFHYMLRNDGTGNFNPVDDGNGNTNLNGYKRSEQIINAANDALINNQKMWLPNPNSTPIPQIRVRYLLTGVYFHNDSRLMTAYTGDLGFPSIDELHSTYGVNTDTEINYYFTRSSWINDANVTYELPGNGLGRIDLHAGISSSYVKYLLEPWWVPMHSSLFNHEIGHILNIGHTWAFEDFCDDTPNHGWIDAQGNVKQCFNHNEPPVICDWNNCSNNVMDYNSWQSSYTTCQVGRMHDHLNSTAGNPYIHSCNGCAPVNAFFDLSGCFKVFNTHPNGTQMNFDPLFLNGEASVNENQYKIEICEVSNLGNSNCTGGYFNSTWINSSINKINLKDLYTFTTNKVYKVELEVASTSCPGTSKMVKYFQISSGGCNYAADPMPAVLGGGG
jgi:hypothetical protein